MEDAAVVDCEKRHSPVKMGRAMCVKQVTFDQRGGAVTLLSLARHDHLVD